MAIGPKLRFKIFKRDNFTCQYCFKRGVDREAALGDLKLRTDDPAMGKLLATLGIIPKEPLKEVSLEVDHRIPESKGGTDDESNLVTSCRDCNRGKGATHI